MYAQLDYLELLPLFHTSCSFPCHSHMCVYCMCVKAQTYSNKDNYVPLYKFNWREAKSFQVPCRLLKLEVICKSSTTLKKFHSVIYGKYGASHQCKTPSYK